MKTDIEGAFVGLAIEIVRQAADDYRAAAKRLIRKPSSEKAKEAVEALKNFFLSDYCTLLCSGVEGEYILEKLDKEAAQWKRRNI